MRDGKRGKIGKGFVRRFGKNALVCVPYPIQGHENIFLGILVYKG